MVAAPQKEAITAVILAGGRGSRMGGVDKGLQLFNGLPLAQHALRRLLPQVSAVMLNANRNLLDYEAFGVPVWPDSDELGEFAGPLAGITAGLQHCATPYLLTVPCDAPLFPADLVARLSAGLAQAQADFAVAASLEANGTVREQSVFCLMRSNMLGSLLRYTAAGGRKVSDWTAQHLVVQVAFNQPGDDANAFFNANTLADLQSLAQPFKRLDPI